MPRITVEMFEGRTVEQKKQLIEGLTGVVMDKLNVPAESVTILIRDIPKHNWASGGKLYSELLPEK